MIRLAQPTVPEAGIEEAVRVLRSGALIQGSECAGFERELASLLGCREVVVVSSGTAALHLSLLALDIGPGDAVLVPDFTFPATANAVALTGARPEIVDVRPDTYNISVPELERVIREWSGTERLRAIIPVHEFGLCADMTAINAIAQTHGLHVVEDAACALGATHGGDYAGTIGDLGCFSFHPRKSLTTGDGGAISTDDLALARRLRRLRNHGIEGVAGALTFVEPGLNYRLTDFQAALGRSQLEGLPAAIAVRQTIAAEYRALLDPLVRTGDLTLPAWSEDHTWQTYMVVLSRDHDRADVIEALRAEGVEANLGAQSLTSLGLYGRLRPAQVGSSLFERGLALPCHSGMTRSDVAEVGQGVKRIIQAAVK